MKTATLGFRPGLRLTLVAPSTRSLSTIPLLHSDGRKTWISGPTRRMACDSEMVYCMSQPSCARCEKDVSSSPVETEKMR